jgi:hypothetical protein
MKNPSTDKSKSKAKPSLKQLDPEKYAYLKAEAEAPYKGLRQFVYIAFAASGFIGAVVFLAQLAAGRDVATALPNFALQIGVVALMVWLFQREGRGQRADGRRK